MRTTRVRSAVLALSVVLLASCDRIEPLAPPATQPEDQAPQVASRTDNISLDRFELDLTIDGTPTPGASVKLHANARGRVSTGLVDVEILLPELELMQRGGGRQLRIGSGDQIRRSASTSGALPAGGELSATHDVVFPQSGVFRVLAVVRKRSDEPDAVSARERYETYEVVEKWLTVSDHVPQVSEDRPRAIFGDSLVNEVGAFIDSDGKNVETIETPLNLPTADPVPGATTRRVVYFDPLFLVYRPVKGVAVSFYQFNAAGSPLMAHHSGTDDEGYIQEPCAHPQAVKTTMKVTLSNARMRNEGSVDSAVVSPLDCLRGTEMLKTVTDYKGHLFVRFWAIGDSMVTKFGQPMPQLLVRMSTTSNNSFFSTSDNTITITDEHLWDEWAHFVQAHEYGHAYHELAISNIESEGGACPSQGHGPGLQSTVGCAFREGLASYLGGQAIDEQLAFSTEHGQEFAHFFYAGPGGHLDEGTVTGFLRDVTDGPSEEWDQVQLPHSWIVISLGSCIEEAAFAPWQLAPFVDGSDQLVYCLERTLDFGVRATYFTNRTWTMRNYPAAPPGWNRLAIRALWQCNYFAIGCSDL